MSTADLFHRGFCIKSAVDFEVGAVMIIMSFGEAGIKCVACSSQILELDAAAQIFFFWCWAYQILSVRIWNWLVKDTMFLATLLMLAECMIATIPFLHKPEHNSCWGWSVWPGLQSNYIYLVLLASVICLQSWKLRRISDAAEAFVLKICWYKTSSWGLGFNLSSCSPCLVQTSQKLKWLWKLQVTMAKAKMKMKTKMQHLSMFHQMRNCNHRSAYTVLILESTDPVKIDLLRSLPEAKHEALRIHLRSDWQGWSI